MARCLRCKAGNEWIEGDVKRSEVEQIEKLEARVKELEAQLAEAKSKSVESVVISPCDVIKHQESELEVLLKENNDLNSELNECVGTMQECLKLLKGNKIVHSTLQKELLDAAKSHRLKWQTGPVPKLGFYLYRYPERKACRFYGGWLAAGNDYDNVVWAGPIPEPEE